MLMSILERVEKWQHAWQRRRAVRLTAQAADLDENETHDLLLLQERGFVRARGSGQSITRIHGEIENLIDRRLHVVIRPGTYFVSAGHCQNMVTRREYRLTLYPTSVQNVAIDAACIDADRPKPQKDNRFRGVRRSPTIWPAFSKPPSAPTR